MAAWEACTGAQIQALVKRGFPIDASLTRVVGHTALHIAAETKNLTTAAALMNLGLSAHAKNQNGESPGFYIYLNRQLM